MHGHLLEPHHEGPEAQDAAHVESRAAELGAYELPPAERRPDADQHDRTHEDERHEGPADDASPVGGTYRDYAPRPRSAYLPGLTGGGNDEVTRFGIWVALAVPVFLLVLWSVVLGFVILGVRMSISLGV